MKSAEDLSRLAQKRSERAIRLTRKRLHLELDYSESSLQTVERILAGIFIAREKHVWIRLLTRPLLARQSRIWGSYLVEVIRRRIGGYWSLEDYPGQRNVPTIVIGRTRIAPMSKVYKRLTIGPPDNVWFYFQTLKNMHAEKTGPFFSGQSSA